MTTVTTVTEPGRTSPEPVPAPPVVEKQHALHAIKKRLSLITTRKKVLEDGLDAEFVTLRDQLDGIYKSLKVLSTQIRTSRQDWTQVAKHQGEFASKLASSLPQGGPVRNHASEVEDRIRHVYRRLIEEDGKGSAHEKLTSILDSYESMIVAIREEYPKVNSAYNETLRYSKKTDKVERRKRDNHEKLNRNATKREAAENKYKDMLFDIIPRMKGLLAKHEAVFQCAHHAFWLASNTYVTTIETATEYIRQESVLTHPKLLDIDVHNTRELPPTARVRMIEGGKSSAKSLTSDQEDEAAGSTVLVEQIDHDDHATPTDHSILPRVESVSDKKKPETIVEDEFSRTVGVDDVLSKPKLEGTKDTLTDPVLTTKVDVIDKHSDTEGPVLA